MWLFNNVFWTNPYFAKDWTLKPKFGLNQRLNPKPIFELWLALSSTLFNPKPESEVFVKESTWIVALIVIPDAFKALLKGVFRALGI